MTSMQWPNKKPQFRYKALKSALPLKGLRLSPVLDATKKDHLFTTCCSFCLRQWIREDWPYPCTHTCGLCCDRRLASSCGEKRINQSEVPASPNPISSIPLGAPNLSCVTGPMQVLLHQVEQERLQALTCCYLVQVGSVRYIYICKCIYIYLQKSLKMYTYTHMHIYINNS